MEPIVRAVTAEGYSDPTAIQAKSIPPIIAGRDLLGCAQTGTGKTGAFALPTLHRLASRPQSGGPKGGVGRSGGRRGLDGRGAKGRRPRALVLCPTRELALQILERFEAYGRGLHLRHLAIYGGVSQAPQVRALRHGVDVLVATPGRLLDLMNQGYVDLNKIEMFVLDEADRMLDMGFIRDIERVAANLPAKRQTLLFSATMPAEIRRLADRMLTDAIYAEASPAATTASSVSQGVYMVERGNKADLLGRMLERDGVGRILVFTRTKHGADKLVKRLKRTGVEAGAIHGNKSQGARVRTLEAFRSGSTPVLIATDIASRGIDVDEVTHVVNFDLPNVPETYVHRIGRTARAGASGVAVSFCDPEERGDLKAIERLIGRKLDVFRDEPEFTSSEQDVKPQNRSHDRIHGARGAGRSGQRGGANRRGAAAGSGAAASSGGNRKRRRSRQRSTERAA